MIFVQIVIFVFMHKYTLTFIATICCLSFCSCKKSSVTPTKSFEDFKDTLKLGSPVAAPTISRYYNQVLISNNSNDPIVDNITDYGYYINPSPGISDGTFKKISLGSTLPHNVAPLFWLRIDSLRPATTYAIRGYIVVKGQVEYAPTINFTTYPGTWKRLKNFSGKGPGLSGHPSGFSVNGKGYAMFNDGSLWQYDVKSDSWIAKNSFDMSHFVNNSEVPHVFFAIGNIAYLYFRGGIWKYDDVNDSWSNILQPAPGNTGPGAAFVIHDKAYILQSSTDYYANAAYSRVYDPASNTLKQINVVSTNLDASGFATANFMYVIGSQSFTYGYPAYTYNPSNDMFTHQTYESQYGPFAPRLDAVSFTINGTAYIGEGGYGGLEDSYFAYDESGPEFRPQIRQYSYTNIETFNLGARSNGLSFVINGRAYVGFGDNGRTDFWEFTP